MTISQLPFSLWNLLLFSQVYPFKHICFLNAATFSLLTLSWNADKTSRDAWHAMTNMATKYFCSLCSTCIVLVCSSSISIILLPSITSSRPQLLHLFPRSFLQSSLPSSFLSIFLKNKKILNIQELQANSNVKV